MAREAVEAGGAGGASEAGESVGSTGSTEPGAPPPPPHAASGRYAALADPEGAAPEAMELDEGCGGAPAGLPPGVRPTPCDHMVRNIVQRPQPQGTL